MVTRRSLVKILPAAAATFLLDSKLCAANSKKSIRDFGAKGDGHSNDIAAFEKSFEYLRDHPGATIYFPDGDYKVAGNSLRLEKDVGLRMEGSAKANILVDCSSMMRFQDMQLNVPTFIIVEGSQNYSEHAVQIEINGLVFKSVGKEKGRLIDLQGCCGGFTMNNNKFFGFSSVAKIGFNKLSDGIHPKSNALTVGKNIAIKNNFVESDSLDTKQCPKFVHVICMSNVLIASNNIIGHGKGYLTRVSGGNYNTVPRQGTGGSDITIRSNKFFSDGAVIEYNQVSKCSGIKLVGNFGDVSKAPKPHNLFDCFNCFDVEFEDNTVIGGGLLFFGHADLNNSSFPKEIPGSRGCVARNNTCINPTHGSVFNIGGDGSAGSNRATSNVIIENNKVYFKVGEGRDNQCFIYTFVSRDVLVRNNEVNGLKYFWRSFNDGIVVLESNKAGGIQDFARIQGKKNYAAFLNMANNRKTVDDFEVVAPFERIDPTKKVMAGHRYVMEQNIQDQSVVSFSFREGGSAKATGAAGSTTQAKRQVFYFARK